MEMLNFVKDSFPTLEIHEIKTNNTGWDNDIFIINNKIVFRFPKCEKLLSKIEDEVAILKQLSSKNPLLQIPDYEYIYEKNKIIGGKYLFLEGKAIAEQQVQNISKNKENAKLIGDFLTKLHSIHLLELEGTNLTTIHTLTYWKDLYDNIKKELFPFLNNQQQEQISHIFDDFLEDYPDSLNKKVVIHGDLTISNIIYQERKERGTDVIDFTDAQIGDPVFDFAGIYWSFGPKFTRNVIASSLSICGAIGIIV